MPIGHIGSHDIERFKARQIQRGRTNKTILNHLTVLHKCLVTAYEWLQLDGSPPKIKWPKCAIPEIDYLSPEECELLLRHAKGVVYEMILFALQWSSVDWLNRSITVRHSLDNHSRELVAPKSGRIRHIPMDADLYEMLYRRKRETGYVFLVDEGRSFTNYRVHYAITHLCKRAGLRKIGWHTLRHTFASHLAMRGAPLNAVQSLLGHSTITMTMRYSHVAPSTLRAVIDLLNPKNIIDADFGQPAGNRWREAQRKEAAQKYPASENA
jgi:integrase